MEIELKVLLYGRLADAIDRQVEIDAPSGCAVADLRGQLVAAYPEAAEALGRSRAFIADELVADDRVPSDGERVEFLPPVSGG